MRWLIAFAVVVVGLLIGAMASAMARRIVEKPNRSERIRGLAAPLGSLVFGLVMSLALVIALGIGDPESLKPLPKNLIAFVPRLITAALFAVVGSAVSSLAGNAVAASVLKATGKPQPQIGRLVRVVVMAVFALLAVSQLGINTKIVDLLVSGVIGSLALSIALLTGLGGRKVAADVAAGRYLRRLLHVGDHIESEPNPVLGRVSGTVVNVHGATVELQGTSDATDPALDRKVIMHIPNAALLGAVLRIERAMDGTVDKPKPGP